MSAIEEEKELMKFYVQINENRRRLGFSRVFIEKVEIDRWVQIINVLNDNWPKKPVLTPERNRINPYIETVVFKYLKTNGTGFKSKFNRMKKLC